MSLNDPVYTLPLTSQKQISGLNKMGIFSILDLLNHFPKKYLDTREISDLAIWDGINLRTSLVKVLENKIFKTRGGKMIVTTVVQDESGTKGEMVWFNQSFMLKAFEVDNYYLIFGKLAKGSTFSKRKLTVNEYERLYDGKGSRHLDKITAIYPETVGVSSKWIRSKINYIFSNINEFFSKDYLPENIRKEYDLIEISSAIRKIHIPSNFIDLDKSRERLGFDEIYTLLSKINLQIQEKQKISANPIKTLINDQECNVNEFLSNLKYSLDMPFTLTKSQQDCIVEVVTDIKSRKPMSRLIQGDVGSGKTVVATAVALSVLQNNYDVVLLCPTTVLAEQHFKTISNFLKNQKFTVKLVTGNSKIDEKESNTKPILYIGTHAILFKKAEVFRNTSLLIVDEQHRFGVEQREQLIDDVVSLNGKTHTPHFLMLTATPIPRSIAQIYFSSLDLSYIATPPNDRKKVLTFVVPENKRADSYNWIKDKIRSGEQMFVICPLIETSEKLALKNVKEEYENIKNIFSDFNVSLLHGKMKAEEKNSILTDFRTNTSQILVSTQVVEVGVDIPNATIIIIESAERFGLAALHQLRGRVGRGKKQSYCYLFISPEAVSVMDEKVDQNKALDRLSYFSTHFNGMELSEFDMMNRGIGNLVGTEQTGLPKFKIANVADKNLIEKVKKVIKIINN